MAALSLQCRRLSVRWPIPHRYPPYAVLVVLFVLLRAQIGQTQAQSQFVPQDDRAIKERIVFWQRGLTAFIQNPSVQAVFLRANISLDRDQWARDFPPNGTAVIGSASGNVFTITSDLQPPPSLGLGQITGFMRVDPGATLNISNIKLEDIALNHEYAPTQSQPYRNVGPGYGLWPTLQLANNATIYLNNVTLQYYKPMDTLDTCAQYTERIVFGLEQVYPGNVQQVSPEQFGLSGPLNITVNVTDGITNKSVGTAMVRVQNYYATCVPYSGNKGSSGLSPGLLAAAVVVPVVVLAALAALGGWLWIRHQRRKKQALQDDGFKMPQAADGDVELGRPGAGQDRTDLRTIAPDGYNLAALKTDAVHGTNVAATGQPMMNQTSSASTAFSSITSSTLPSSTPVGSPMVGLQGSGATTGGAARLHGSADSACDPRMSAASASTAASSKRGDMAGMLGPGSGGQLASSADTLTEMQGAQEQRGSGNSGGGSGSGERTAAGSGIPPSLQVLLSQSRRSQGSVLKELELGPLIGKGSYGRVHKGRWKAATVAVKIIEHKEGPQSSHGNNVDVRTEALLATSMAHPNVVQTYHIETFPVNDHDPLPCKKLVPEDERVDDEAAESSGDEEHSNSGSQAARAEILETWMILEYCERGSLDRAVSAGRFVRRDNQQPEMIGIYKALLDIISGLDYLHSRGVVHGDLKSGNVLLKGTSSDSRGFICKLGDFGLSRVLDLDATHISTRTYGTICYMPKELLAEGKMTTAADIYSLGLMMWELYTGQRLFDESISLGQVFYMIVYQKWRPVVPDTCPAGFAAVMAQCWEEDAEVRPSASQVLRDLQRLYNQEKKTEKALKKAAASISNSAATNAVFSAEGTPLTSTAVAAAAAGGGGGGDAPMFTDWTQAPPARSQQQAAAPPQDGPFAVQHPGGPFAAQAAAPQQGGPFAAQAAAPQQGGPFAAQAAAPQQGGPFAAQAAAPQQGGPFAAQAAAPQQGGPFAAQAAAPQQGGPFAAQAAAPQQGGPFAAQAAAPQQGGPFAAQAAAPQEGGPFAAQAAQQSDGRDISPFLTHPETSLRGVIHSVSTATLPSVMADYQSSGSMASMNSPAEASARSLGSGRIGSLPSTNLSVPSSGLRESTLLPGGDLSTVRESESDGMSGGPSSSGVPATAAEAMADTAEPGLTGTGTGRQPATAGDVAGRGQQQASRPAAPVSPFAMAAANPAAPLYKS
eukprot:jgi/Chrzof1/13793/Cz08g12190.t1